MKPTKQGDYPYRAAHYGLINCYLVVEDDGLSIVDTGVGGTTRLLEEAVQKLRGPVKRILLTHTDDHHLGCLDALHARCPEAEVLIGGREARLSQGDTGLEPGEPQVKLRKKRALIRTQPRPC